MVFQLNSSIFNRQVLPLLGPVDLQSVVMTCGDGNSLSLDFRTSQFDGSCYYFSQWQYPVVLTITYVDRQTTETKVATYDIWSLQFVSEIAISVQDGTITQGAGELVAGKAPRKITFDASAVFRDLWLPDYRIVWDVDGDGKNDGENVSDITRIYNQPQLYNVVVRFPGVNTFAYTFPLRIEQPNVPICILTATQLQWTSYRIQADLTGRVARIDGYDFSIIDVSNGRAVVWSEKSVTNAVDYVFPGQGTYAVKLDFITSDGRQGSCESQNIAVGQADFAIQYDILYKSPAEPKFTKVDPTTPVSLQWSTLTVQELPTIVQLHITDIQPVSASATVSVFFNDVAILSSDNKTFEMRVNSKEWNTIKIVVDDPVRSARTEQQISVDVQQAPVVGKLEIRPDTVWNDPFVVTFDASTTLLNDPSDEIVYFSWDFGDGIVKPNVSQSVITHTYNYDYDNENGIFKPSVDITTKKWRSITIRPSTDIIVKKAVQEVLIRIDSHPAQIARIGDTVEFWLDVTGLPTSINRDFGNGNILSLPGRQWVNVTQVFTENKDYTIKVTVEYENQPSVEGKIVLKVQ